MSRRAAGAAALLACAGLIAGCASHPTRVTGAGPPLTAPLSTPLSTSLVTAQGTWAVAVMGGPDADNKFWQLFFRPVTGGGWSLVTPQGVADNGGLVAAGGGAHSLFAAWWNATRWTVSAPVTADGVRAFGFGPDGSAWLLPGRGRPEAVAGPASSTWRPLPPVPAGTQVLVPAGTQVLVPGAGGSYDALAVTGSRLTVWRLGQGAWAKIQQVTVPVQYGSSG